MGGHLEDLRRLRNLGQRPVGTATAGLDRDCGDRVDDRGDYENMNVIEQQNLNKYIHTRIMNAWVRGWQGRIMVIG